MSLKPVSDKQRKLLALLGETPKDHQAQMQALLARTYTSANSTAKQVSIHVLNKQVEAKLTYSEPTKDIVARLEGTAFIAEDWIPNAYVIFVRRFSCRCGRTGRCLERPQLFLRYRPSRKRPDATQASGPPLLYLPVKSLAYPNLPRLQEVSFAALQFCEECFEDKTQCLKQFSSDKATTYVTTSATQVTRSPSPANGFPSLCVMRWEDDGGLTLTSSASDGSCCAENDDVSPAPAAPTPIHTTEVRANA